MVGIAIVAIAIILTPYLFAQEGVTETRLRVLIDAPARCDGVATIFVELTDRAGVPDAPINIDLGGQVERSYTDNNGRLYTAREISCGEQLTVVATFEGDSRHTPATATATLTTSSGRTAIPELQKQIVKIDMPGNRGSGIVLSQGNGKTVILTNKHVMSADISKVNVIASNGATIHPSAVFFAPNGMDLAVIEVSGNVGVTARIGTGFSQGDDVIAIGSPKGIQGSVSKGIVSNTGNDRTPGGYKHKTIQTDAAINNGNSGGGLFLENGELIGIITFKMKETEGMNFAIDISEYERLGDYREW
jgi:S1-C subfamily serine protease